MIASMPRHVPSWTAAVLPVVAALALASSPLAGQKPQGVVEGRVLGPLGDPLPNVEVEARLAPRDTARLGATRTDGEGVFRLGRLPTECPVHVIAHLPGHSSAIALATIGHTVRQTNLTLRLWQANTVRGRVVDANGKPVAGAAVIGTKDHTGYDGSFLAPEAVSDATGKFELVGVPIGDCVVRAWAPGFELREHLLNTVADTSIEVVLAPGEGTLLSIYVKGLPAAELASVEVRVDAMRNGAAIALPSAIERAHLDDKGQLVLEGLPRAEWNVRMQAPGYRFDPPTATTVNGQFVHVLPFKACAVTNITLRGSLRDTDGNALSGQRLIARARPSRSLLEAPGFDTTTDADGQFALPAPFVRAQAYDLFLAGSSWVLKQPRHRSGPDQRGIHWLEFADPDRQLELIATPSAFVKVRLVDADGKPASFTTAQLQQYYPGVIPPWRTLTRVVSGRDGALDFGGLPGGPEVLRVHVAGEGGCGDSKDFKLGVGERDTIEVVLDHAATVRGRVVDAAGNPLAGVRLTLSNWDLAADQQVDTEVTSVTSDREGRFVFTGVLPGGHRVATALYEFAGEGSSQPFEAEAGASTEVELRLAK
ncbi:MAG: carboxypeptidase regulatory-like domain-containing protein [Planctomycetes bacterium]|nr:carboxypeptidase regulatory-like domain-containing protein [Planctomycetota bacterium]